MNALTSTEWDVINNHIQYISELGFEPKVDLSVYDNHALITIRRVRGEPLVRLFEKAITWTGCEIITYNSQDLSLELQVRYRKGGW